MTPTLNSIAFATQRAVHQELGKIPESDSALESMVHGPEDREIQRTEIGKIDRHLGGRYSLHCFMDTGAGKKGMGSLSVRNQSREEAPFIDMSR